MQEQPAWLNRLELEHDNLRRALDTAGAPGLDPTLGARLGTALHTFWRVRGYLAEGRSWLEQIITRRRDAGDVAQMRVLNSAGVLAEHRGDLVAAERHLQRALGIAAVLDERHKEAGILSHLGALKQRAGDLAASRGFHEASMQIYRELGDPTGVAWVQLNLVDVAMAEQRDEEARALLDECLPVFRREGDRQRIAVALNDLGQIAWRDGITVMQPSESPSPSSWRLPARWGAG